MRKRVRLVMIIVAVAFIAGFLMSELWNMIGRSGGRQQQDPNLVGVIGGHKVTAEEWRNAVNYTTDKYKQENQLRDLSAGDYAQIQDRAWQFLVTELTWGKLYEQTKTRISQDEVLEIMKANPPEDLRDRPELKDSTGQFSRDKYIELMNNQQNQQYFAKYFQDLAEMLPKEKLRLDVLNSYRVTGAEQAEATRGNSTWKVTSLYFGPRLLTEKIEPTEAEARAWYDKHPDDFKGRELRQLRYVKFPLVVTGRDSADALEQIQSAYTQLQSGEDFNLTVMDFSNLIAETTSTMVARSRLDARTDTVLKSLKPGQYSAPFLADYGWQIVQLDSAKTDSIAVRRILIRVQIGEDAVASVRDSVQSFADRAKEEDFDSLAAQLNIPVMRARPWVGGEPNFAGLDLASPSQLSEWAKRAKTGDVLDKPMRGQSGYYVFQLTEVKPAKVQPFEEVKEAATWRVRQEREKGVWLAKAREAVDQLKAGKTFEQYVAENPNVEVQTEEFAGSFDARRRKGAEFAGAVAALDSGQMAGVVETNWGAFVVRCDGRSDSGQLQPEQFAQQRQQQVGQELMQGFLKDPEIRDYRDQLGF
jgi:parvulin-like peptidyl-prolyl isomerase